MTRRSEQLGQDMSLGTITFLTGGEYFGLEARPGTAPDSVSLSGVASSFIRTRQVNVDLSGQMVVSARHCARQLADAMGFIWELGGSVGGGLTPFPFLECEPVPLPGTPGALVRVMSEWGEQRCLYLTGCPDRDTTAWLTACLVVAAALLDSAPKAAQSDRTASVTADAVITVLGQAGADVAGDLSMTWCDKP